MPDHQSHTVSGRITHVFGHRFVVETGQGAVLADITPKGCEQITLRIGDEVQLTGEMKPSELKVSRFTSGGATVSIAHKPKPHDHHPHASPREAIHATRAAGYEPVGEPRRKPKHFEVLGRRGRELIELHVELDGHIRKTKPVAAHDPKWSDALQA